MEGAAERGWRRGGTGSASGPCALRRRSSSFRLSSPLAIAQWWFAEKAGRRSQLSRRSSGLVALTRQS